MSPYFSAYWVSEDGESSEVLSGPEHSTLRPHELLAVGQAEASARALSGGHVKLGEWPVQPPIETQGGGGPGEE